MALVSPFFSVAQESDGLPDDGGDGGKDKKCVTKTGFDESAKKECKGQGTACSSDSDCK